MVYEWRKETEQDKPQLPGNAKCLHKGVKEEEKKSFPTLGILFVPACEMECIKFRSD